MTAKRKKQTKGAQGTVATMGAWYPTSPKPSSSGTRWTPEELAIFKEEYVAGGGHREVAKRLTQRLGRVVTSNAVCHMVSRSKEKEILAPTSQPLKGKAKIEEAAVKELETVKRLVTLTKKPATLESLCNVLDVSPVRLKSLADAARKNGYRVHIEGDHIGRPPQAPSEKTFDILVKSVTSRHTIAVVGDIHFGSKHHLGPQFKDFCDKAYARGARQFLHVGDLLDGVYKHSQWEQAQRGFEDQCDYAISHLPKYKNAVWHFIQGNHDETFANESGLEVGRAIVEKFRSAGRIDLAYYGARGAYLRLRDKNERRGLYVELWHPGKGAAYAKSYKIQKRVEGYSVGAKPDLLCVGHYHQSLYTVIRGVHAISAGCWQGSGSSFAKSLGTAPDIGSWIVEYALTKDGTVRDFSPSWVTYYETETAREVALG